VAKPKVKVPPAPEKIEDLSREGLIFLVRMVCPFVSRYDLVRARWHELVQDGERAYEKAKAAGIAYEALLRGPQPSIDNMRAYHKARLRFEEARARDKRASDAAQRAQDVAMAFFEAHIALPSPASEAAE